MKISNNGLNLIKQFEGCRLIAYKSVATEKYFTIGYGHTGEDVKPNMVISQAQADRYLQQDIGRYENYVNQYCAKLNLNQNQFDAITSFTYNCGPGNLKKLIEGRTISQIADAMLQFNHAGGKELAGLTKRRKAERELFIKRDVKIIIGSAVLGIALNFLNLNMWVALPVGIIIYFATTYFLKLFDNDDKYIIKEILGKN